MTTRQAKDPVVIARHLCMMTSRHGIKTQDSRSLAQTIKLQMSVALDARVWRNAVNMGLHVWCDDMFVEVVRKIKHQVIDTELLCHSTSVVYIGDRTTPSVALATPQTHRHTHNFVTLID